MANGSLHGRVVFLQNKHSGLVLDAGPNLNICQVILLKNLPTLGAFIVTDNHVLNGPLGRLLRSFACTAHSPHLLFSAPLCYARFARLLHLRARSLTLLTPLWGVEIQKYVFMPRCKRVQWEQTRFWSSLETRPLSLTYSVSLES